MVSRISNVQHYSSDNENFSFGFGNIDNTSVLLDLNCRISEKMPMFNKLTFACRHRLCISAKNFPALKIFPFKRLTMKMLKRTDRQLVGRPSDLTVSINTALGPIDKNEWHAPDVMGRCSGLH